MKTLSVVIASAFLILISIFSVNSAEYDDLLKQNNADGIYNSLPDSTKQSLNDIGLNGFDYSKLNNLNVENILSEILNTIGEEGKTPLKAFSVIIAIMLLYSILYGLKNSVDTALQPVLSLIVTICITTAIVIPITGFITSIVDTIKASSDFMISFIPIMVLALSVSGQPVSGMGYYSAMMLSGQAVSRISSEIISPFMKIFLAVSVSSSISPSINLSGIVRFISKFTKIVLGFVMSLFTGILSFKHVVAVGADSVSSRAVRFSLSSFVPVVGSALSEAYRTVQGSVGVLKSGVGIIAVIAVCAMYLPVIIQCLFWMLVLGLSKAVGEILNLREPCVLLESVYSVISTLLAVALCLMAVFVISTALVILIGGYG